MSFKRYEGTATEYQGTSFTRTLIKKDKIAWTAENIGYWKMVDGLGVSVASGTLEKVNTDFGFKFEVNEEDTVALLGSYLLVAYLKDTVNLGFSRIIAEYVIVYNEVKAT